MNIRAISAWQKCSFDTQSNRWVGINCFKEYVQFCQQRRGYQRGRKGLTRLGRDLRKASRK